MKKIVYNKLVRDNIPNQIEENGEYAITRILSKEELDNALNEKLLEEAAEIIGATTKEQIAEELADVLEVIYAKAKANNIRFLDVELARQRKKGIKGAFDDRVFLIHTVDQEYVDANKGCQTCINGTCKVPNNEKLGLEDGKPAGYDCSAYESCYKKSK